MTENPQVNYRDALLKLHALIDKMPAATAQDLAADGPVGVDEDRVWDQIEALKREQADAIQLAEAPRKRVFQIAVGGYQLRTQEVADADYVVAVELDRETGVTGKVVKARHYDLDEIEVRIGGLYAT